MDINSTKSRDYKNLIQKKQPFHLSGHPNFSHKLNLYSKTTHPGCDHSPCHVDSSSAAHSMRGWLWSSSCEMRHSPACPSKNSTFRWPSRSDLSSTRKLFCSNRRSNYSCSVKFYHCMWMFCKKKISLTRMGKMLSLCISKNTTATCVFASFCSKIQQAQIDTTNILDRRY